MRALLLLSLFWLFVLFTQAQNFTNSNLPIVVITTDIDPNTGGRYYIRDEPKTPATMKIIYRPDGSRNYLADQSNPAYLNYDGRIGIETRGSSSQALPKKPYGLSTFANDNITNNNVSILGMPKENDWVLNSVAFDESLLRNYLSYYLARSMGMYASRGAYCEVVINDEYMGLYIFMEKLKIDTERINILKMTDTDNNLPDVTGGYVVKADKTTGGDPIAWSMSSYTGGVGYIHENPDPWHITDQQSTYIHSQFTNLQNMMTAANVSSINGFASIIDVPSFIDFMILNELASNADAYQFSTYFHKDRNGKLRAGPVWDFDLTYGNDLFMWGLNRSFYNVWQFDNGDNTGSKFWRDLHNNPTFKCYLSKRWKELSSGNGPLSYSAISAKIDEIVYLTSEAAFRENTKWNTVNDRAGEITEMKTWLQSRITWLNTRWGSYSSCSNPALPSLVISKINYNPSEIQGLESDDLEFIEISNNGSQVANLSGVYFSELGLSYQFPANSLLQAGKSLVLASNADAFKQIHGIYPFGQFTRNVSNKSQKLVLADAFGNVIDSVRYSDQSPWHVEADGVGYYLELINLNSDNSLAANWKISSHLLSDIVDNAAQSFVHVYPNPAQSKITVSSQQKSINSYEVIDLRGRTVLLQTGINSDRFTIDIEYLYPAVYLLKINCGNNESIVQKIIKMPSN